MLSSMRPAPAGFSLTELLVVTAILAVLASLMLPLIASLRQQARTAYCMNRQSQLFLALRGYADDHQNQFVYLGCSRKGWPDYSGGEMWYDTLVDYVGNRSCVGTNARDDSLWDCPQFRIGNQFGALGGYSGHGMVAGIAIIHRGPNSSRSTKFVNPSDTVNAPNANYRLRWSEFSMLGRRIIAGDAAKEFLDANSEVGANQAPFYFGRSGQEFYNGAPARHSHPGQVWGGLKGDASYRAVYLHADGHVEMLNEPTAAWRTYHRSAQPPP